MKTYQILLYKAALLGGLLGTSCSNQEEVLTASDRKVPLEVQIKSSGTRTVIMGTELPNQSNLGVFSVSKGNGETTASNVLASYANNRCDLAKTVYLAEVEENVYAYYPYSEKASLTSIPVEVKSQTDYLYGYAVDGKDEQTTVSALNPKANILLKHALARITLNIRKGEDNENFDIFSASLSGDLPVSGTLDITKGAIACNGYGDVYVSCKANITEAITFSLDILVFPADLSERDVLLSLNVIDCDKNDKYVSAVLPKANWQSGQQYTYSVEIRNGNLVISQATITPWNDNLQDSIEITDNNYTNN